MPPHVHQHEDEIIYVLEGEYEFFLGVQDNLEIHGFAVNALAEGPGVIIALFDIGATVKRTGKRIVARDEAQVWHFNEAGKAARFRHCADAYQQAMDCKA